MEEHPIEESAWRRGWEDTRGSFHSIKFFWSVEVVAVSGFVYLATILTPEGVSKYISAGYQVIGAIVGAMVGFGFIYLMMLVLAPYRQRNEARKELKARQRPQPLENKKELIEAIVRVGQATRDFIFWREKVNKAYEGYKDPGMILADLMSNMNNCNDQCRMAINDLEVQCKVAGSAFENAISPFSLFAMRHMTQDIVKGGPQRLNFQQFVAEVNNKENETIQRIGILTGEEPEPTR